jgi:hypothetical protein
MILDEEKRTRRDIVQASCSTCGDENPGSKRGEAADRAGYRFQGMSFVPMNSPFQDRDGNTVPRPEV